MYQPTDFADTIFRQRYALNHEESWEELQNTYLLRRMETVINGVVGSKILWYQTVSFPVEGYGMVVED